jgi:hypothetical protein
MLPLDQPELTQAFPETSDPRGRRLSDAQEADAPQFLRLLGTNGQRPGGAKCDEKFAAIVHHLSENARIMRAYGKCGIGVDRLLMGLSQTVDHCFQVSQYAPLMNAYMRPTRDAEFLHSCRSLAS